MVRSARRAHNEKLTALELRRVHLYQLVVVVARRLLALLNALLTERAVDVDKERLVSHRLVPVTRVARLLLVYHLHDAAFPLQVRIGRAAVRELVSKVLASVLSHVLEHHPVLV